MRAVVRLLSWPFLFIGGIGTARQIIYFFSDEAADNIGKAFLWFFIALAILGIGFLLRWLSTIRSYSDVKFSEVKNAIKSSPGNPNKSGNKHHLLGKTCPELILHDKRGNPVSLTKFNNKIVVVKTWSSSEAINNDREIWKNVDDNRVVFCHVYDGNDQNLFQEQTIPKWQNATSYFLTDLKHDVDRLFNTLTPVFYTDYFIIDGDSIVQCVRPRGTNKNDTQLVKQLLKTLPLEGSNSEETPK